MSGDPETKRCHGLTSSPSQESLAWPCPLYPHTCPVFLPGVNITSEEHSFGAGSLIDGAWGTALVPLILCGVLFVARGTRGEARISGV